MYYPWQRPLPPGSEPTGSKLPASRWRSRTANFAEVPTRKNFAPTDITNEIVQAAKELYREKFRGTSVRLIGVRASDITKEGSCTWIDFVIRKEKLTEMLDQSIDAIRIKYGRMQYSGPDSWAGK